MRGLVRPVQDRLHRLILHRALSPLRGWTMHGYMLSPLRGSVDLQQRLSREVHSTSNRLRTTFVLAVIVLASAAGASELDALVLDVAGTNEQARTTARQLLPRHGVAAMPELMPLLAHENAAISKTAYNILGDIVNQATAPGRDDDRLACTQHLMTLVAPEQPDKVRFRGLELLAIAVPEGYDLAPVAALLSDPEARERARYALEQMGTREACRVLLDAMPDADPLFLCGLLDSVGKMREPISVEPVVLLLGHGNADVRAAAALALAWTGDPALVDAFDQVRASATPETRFAATDAMLQLADAMARSGGNWHVAIHLFKFVIETASESVLRQTAMMGLGRFGDETVVPVMVRAVQGAEADLDLGASIILAFEALEGRAASEAMVAACPGLPEHVRPGIVEMFGRQRDPLFVSVIAAELASDDPACRLAALDALAETGVIEALSALVNVAESGNEEEKARALDGALRLAGAMVSTGQHADAGKAYLKLYGLAREDAVRVKALEGLAQHPVADAYDVVMAALENPALEQTAAQALPGLFGPLAQAGDQEKALEVFETVASKNPSPDQLLAMAAQLQGVKTDLDTTRLLGVVKSWHLIGPFHWGDDKDWDEPFVGEPDVDLEATYAQGDAYLSWKPHRTTSAAGFVDLIGAVAQCDRAFAYAYTEVTAPRDMAGQIRVGSDDGNRVWLNGDMVWHNPVDRGAAIDQDIVDVNFKEGVNRILVKISQGAGGWNFCLRVTTPNGLGIDGGIE